MNREQRRAFAASQKMVRIVPMFLTENVDDEQSLTARRADFAEKHKRELEELRLKTVPVPGEDLEESVQTSLIDGDIGECFVIRVPNSTSVQKANEIEARLTETLKRPCLVVTRNIEFCRVEPVSPSEMAKLLKGVNNAGPTSEERAAMAGSVTTTEGGIKVIDKRGAR